MLTKHRYSIGGLIAILFWSTNVAFGRSVSEKIGVITTPAIMFSVAGLVGCLYLVMTRQFVSNLRALSWNYLIGCGLCFFVNVILFRAGIGLAQNREQLLAVGIIVYMWPTVTLLLSLPLLHRKASWVIWPAIGIATAGVVLALSPDLSVFTSTATYVNPVPLFCAFGASINWALYSNLSRRFAGDTPRGAVALFMLLTGVVLGAFVLWRPEPSTWDRRVVYELAFTTVANPLGNVLWDLAMRKGDHTFVTACSYAIPVLSTAICCAYLGISAQPGIWAAAFLVVVGATLAKVAISPSAISPSAVLPVSMPVQK